MDNSFFAYLQRLELMAFFSAYPLLYAIINVIAGSLKKAALKQLPLLLPFAYALVGLLYLGLQLKNLYPDYSVGHIKSSFQEPVLQSWALLSLLFLVPVLHKKPVLSLLHSLVFFFFLVRDLFLQSYASSADKSIVRNDMNIYTTSLLINLVAFLFIVFISFLFTHFKKR